VVRLEVPGVIRYRDLVLRAVSAACKVGAQESGVDGEVAQELSVAIISAVGEAFNNIALHGYAGREPGFIRLEMDVEAEGVRVRLEDQGRSFDPASAASPDLDSLPESGMGVFILRSMMDEVTYVPGAPNTLTLFKRTPRSAPPPR
jgi:serine/threonine-protein kinase RsbW